MKRLVLGLTGGLGSGKSTVLELFRGLGARTWDADRVVHSLLAPRGAAEARVRRLFGPGVLGPRGALDRGKIAARVFRNGALRKRLESILHPLVRRDMARAVRAHRRGLLVLDVPLLYESGFVDAVDQAAVVWAPLPVRLRRLRSGRGIAPAEARRRMKAQLPLTEKRRRADHVIDNGGPLASTRAQVRDLWDRLDGLR